MGEKWGGQGEGELCLMCKMKKNFELKNKKYFRTYQCHSVVLFN